MGIPPGADRDGPKQKDVSELGVSTPVSAPSTSRMDLENSTVTSEPLSRKPEADTTSRHQPSSGKPNSRGLEARSPVEVFLEAVPETMCYQARVTLGELGEGHSAILDTETID